MQPLDLIKTARRIIGPRKSRRPRQSDLRRAISTAYYALFHALCQNCADCMIGTNAASRSASAWRQAYRAIEHSYTKKQCRNHQVMSKFPKEIEDFASLFYDLQVERHATDYDPFRNFTLSDVIATIDAAELAIKTFNKTGIKHRRAFAAWTAMKHRTD